ncbi:MAG: hypothetical protein JO039_18875 [Solirubrobacterales bacterium]|nr:hypothetical protein [Solirubrobacterales bacterium]
MNHQTETTHRRARPAVPLPGAAVPLAGLLVLLACPAAGTAYPSNPVRVADFARSGALSAGGPTVAVSGPIACWKAGQVTLRATNL